MFRTCYDEGGAGGPGPGSAEPSGAPASAPASGGEGGTPPTGTPAAPAANRRQLSDQQIRAWASKVARESADTRKLIAELQKTRTSPTPASDPAKAASPMLEKVRATLGDEATEELLSHLKNQGGNVKEETESFRGEMQNELFYMKFPDMREFQPVMTRLSQMVESGQMPMQWVLGLAARGARMDEMFAKAKKGWQADWEKTERQKLIASLGPGAGITPKTDPQAQERNLAERKRAFPGVKDHKVTHAPADA